MQQATNFKEFNMMTREEAHKAFDEWFNNGCVGNIFFFRAPRSQMVDGFMERVIKLHEMSTEEKTAEQAAFTAMNCIRMEMFSTADDKLDRVKITKRL
jgi:hypothetical protein